MEGAKVTALQNSLLTKLDKVESDIPDWVPRYQQQFQKETKKAQAETRAQAHNPIQVTPTKVIDHTYNACERHSERMKEYIRMVYITSLGSLLPSKANHT